MLRGGLGGQGCYVVRVSIVLPPAPYDLRCGVAERRSRRQDPARETARNVSRGETARTGRFSALAGGSDPLSLAVTALGAVGGLLMAVSLFTTIVSVNVANGACEVINDSDPGLAAKCQLSGFERHSVALLLLGVIAIVMAVGAGRGRSRPAAAALLVIGSLVLGLAIFSDEPVTKQTGAIGRNFEGAKAEAGSGFYLEIAAGALAGAAGALGLLVPRRGRANAPARGQSVGHTAPVDEDTG